MDIQNHCGDEQLDPLEYRIVCNTSIIDALISKKNSNLSAFTEIYSLLFTNYSVLRRKFLVLLFIIYLRLLGRVKYFSSSSGSRYLELFLTSEKIYRP